MRIGGLPSTRNQWNRSIASFWNRSPEWIFLIRRVRGFVWTTKTRYFRIHRRFAHVHRHVLSRFVSFWRIRADRWIRTGNFYPDWCGRKYFYAVLVTRIRIRVDGISEKSKLLLCTYQCYPGGNWRGGGGILIRHSCPREWLLTLWTRPRVRIFDFSLSRGRAVWPTSLEWNESMLYLILFNNKKVLASCSRIHCILVFMTIWFRGVDWKNDFCFS